MYKLEVSPSHYYIMCDGFCLLKKGKDGGSEVQSVGYPTERQMEGSVDFRLGNPPIRVLHVPRVIQLHHC